MKDQSQPAGLPQPLIMEFELTADEFIQGFAAVSQEDINRIPFEGSWTAAQVAEHIRLSVSGTIQIINGPVKATNRSPDQFAKTIKDLFLDFNAVYPTAPVLVPADKDFSKAELTAQLKPIFKELQNGIETKDLTDTCLAAEFTGIGYLTRLEWITVAIYHTQRHTHQLDKIMHHLAS